jgi:hypothetical protein
VTASSLKKNSDRLARRVVAVPVVLVDPVVPVVPVVLVVLVVRIERDVPKARAVQGALKNSNLLT